jgi:hypothetical protein
MKRFWEKVIKGKKNECWNWRTGKPYPHFRLSKTENIPAHRVSWILTYGPIPRGKGYHGMCVCHSCDNPSCVNPHHLWLGSNSDNAKDKAFKGRTKFNPRKGETHHKSKFTNKDVFKIRKLYASGKYIQEDLAQKFGVKRRAIGRVIDGTRWGHLG